MPPKHVIVIGAGICGLSSAIWLRRAGAEVTLIDRTGPGAGASYGNAGLLAEWGVAPVNTPGIHKTALKYMLNPSSPLFMQWRHMPRLIPWLRAFLRNSTDTRVREISTNLALLLHDSADQHRALVRGTRAEKWLATSDFAYVYKSRAAFDADKYGWELRRPAGFIPELIEGGAVQEFEPMLGPNANLIALTRNHGHILNPGAYMADLAQVFQDEGGTLRIADMRDVTLTEGHITQVITDHVAIDCDAAVISAGIWSKPLMKKLGLNVPLEAERGYHLHLKNPSQMPKTPMMIGWGKFAVTPMDGAVRCAGMVELGSINEPPSKQPIDLLRRFITEAFPDLEWEEAEEWLGFRPSTPDTLPLIGEVGVTGVHAAFGHQHVGLTGGPKTGRWVAEMITGKGPNADLSAFDAQRFS